MKHLPTFWSIWRLQQHRRSESSKEGTTHNIQRVPHQRAPRLKIYQQSKSKDRAVPQKERNNILWLIYKRLKEVAVEEADALPDQITPPIIVQDTDDNLMGMNKVKAGARRYQQWALQSIKIYCCFRRHLSITQFPFFPQRTGGQYPLPTLLGTLCLAVA